MGRKKVKAKHHPSSKKVPRIDQSLINPLDNYPVWRVEHLESEGPWDWQCLDRNSFFFDILPKIQNFERMFWRDILNRNNHEISVSQISKEAQKRLAELNLDDVDTLVSLRLTGTQRIWGIRVENIFKVLWWDPQHQVYPSLLKHT
jgi:hypothetical protein